MSALLLALALGLSTRPQYLELRHSGDYGPFGNGPHFTVTLAPDNVLHLYAHQWLSDDGEYILDLSRSDRALLLARVEDLLVTSPDPPELAYCTHSPDFGFTLIQRDAVPETFTSTVCVSAVRQSRFRELYSLIEALTRESCIPVRLTRARERTPVPVDSIR